MFFNHIIEEKTVVPRIVTVHTRDRFVGAKERRREEWIEYKVRIDVK